MDKPIQSLLSSKIKEGDGVILLSKWGDVVNESMGYLYKISEWGVTLTMDKSNMTHRYSWDYDQIVELKVIRDGEIVCLWPLDKDNPPEPYRLVAEGITEREDIVFTQDGWVPMPDMLVGRRIHQEMSVARR